MKRSIRDWLLRLLEPWRETKASETAVQHPEQKVELYEFPYGPDSKDDPIDPDALKRQLLNDAKDKLG